MKLSNNLKNLRELHNYSQMHLAKHLQISRTTYANYEQGRREPDYYTLLKIADLYQVSLDFLLGRSELGLKIIEKELDFPSPAYKDIYKKLISLNARDINLLKKYLNVLCEKEEEESL